MAQAGQRPVPLHSLAPVVVQRLGASGVEGERRPALICAGGASQCVRQTEHLDVQAGCNCKRSKGLRRIGRDTRAAKPVTSNMHNRNANLHQPRRSPPVHRSCPRVRLGWRAGCRERWGEQTGWGRGCAQNLARGGGGGVIERRRIPFTSPAMGHRALNRAVLVSAARPDQWQAAAPRRKCSRQRSSGGRRRRRTRLDLLHV